MTGNGHDTFSDFVTLVCQEAGQPKSPNKLVSYYSSSMFPPAPTAPMARPVSVKISESPGLNMQISPSCPPSHNSAPQLREVRLSPSSPDSLPRTILYTYSSTGTISIPEALSPANLSIVQPPRVSTSSSKASTSSTPASIRWSSSNGAFISDLDSSGISYDLMTPMISGSAESHPGASISLNDGNYKVDCRHRISPSNGNCALSSVCTPRVFFLESNPISTIHCDNSHLS